MATGFKSVIGLLAAVVVITTAACAGAPAAPTPNIEATVEARVKEETASQPTPTPTATNTPVLTATPTPKLKPTPNWRWTWTPEPTSIPRPTRKPTSTPNPAYLYFDKGKTHYQNGEYLLAVNDFTEAISHDPHANYYNWRGGSYYQLAMETTFDESKQRKYYDKAIDNHAEVILLDRENQMAYYSRGMAYYRLEKYEEAIGNYDRVIELDQSLRWPTNGVVILITG